MKYILNVVKRYLSKYPNEEAIYLLPFNKIYNNYDKNLKNDSLKIIFENDCEYFYNILFIRLLKKISSKSTIIPYGHNVFLINAASGSSIFKIILRSFKSVVLNKQWMRIYKIHGIQQTNDCCNHIFKGIPIKLKRAYYEWKTIKKIPLDKIRFYILDGVHVGDLLIDSYLRFSSKNQFNPNTLFFLYLVWRAVIDIEKNKIILSRINPDYYFSSYSSFINHGIPIRVAINSGVDVRVFSNPRTYFKKLTNNYWFHTDSGFGYKSKALLNIELNSNAEKNLNERFSGRIDDAILYMRHSPYSNNTNKFNKIKSVDYVLFLHSFSDAPHCYPGFIYPDFWSWAVDSIEFLIESKKFILIKPHPNETKHGLAIIRLLKKRYPNINFIDAEISNRELIENGLKLGITAYGTIAHELAYFGIPTLVCAHNPHSEFNFIRLARSIKEYKELILNFPLNHYADKKELKTESIEFYASHNLSSSKNESEMRTVYANLHRKFNINKNNNEINDLYTALESTVLYNKIIEDITFRV